MPPIAKVSAVHEQIMNWLLMNPGKSMRECADTFGYTQSWLSTMVHSDAFQSKLREKQLEIQARVTATIPQKLQAVADIALDKLASAVERSEDPDFLLAVADKTLHRMGYAPAQGRAAANQPGAPLVQNNFLVSAGELEQARALMRVTPAEPAPLEGEVIRGDS